MNMTIKIYILCFLKYLWYSAITPPQKLNKALKKYKAKCSYIRNSHIHLKKAFTFKFRLMFMFSGIVI